MRAHYASGGRLGCDMNLERATFSGVYERTYSRLIWGMNVVEIFLVMKPGHALILK